MSSLAKKLQQDFPGVYAILPIHIREKVLKFAKVTNLSEDELSELVNLIEILPEDGVQTFLKILEQECMHP